MGFCSLEESGENRLVAVATRAHQQAAGLGAALVVTPRLSDRPIGRTEPAVSGWARYSWSAGLGWAEQSHLLRHHSAQLLDRPPVGAPFCTPFWRVFSQIQKRTGF